MNDLNAFLKEYNRLCDNRGRVYFTGEMDFEMKRLWEMYYNNDALTLIDEAHTELAGLKIPVYLYSPISLKLINAKEKLRGK